MLRVNRGNINNSTAIGNIAVLLISFIGLHCSRSFIYEERDLALFKSEVNKAISFVHRVTAKGLAKEDVPVGLPLLIHVFFHNFCNLYHTLIINKRYLNTLRFKVMLIQSPL